MLLLLLQNVHFTLIHIYGVLITCYDMPIKGIL